MILGRVIEGSDGFLILSSIALQTTCGRDEPLRAWRRAIGISRDPDPVANLKSSVSSRSNTQKRRRHRRSTPDFWLSLMAGLTTSWLALRLFEDRGTVRLLMPSCAPVRVRAACVLVSSSEKFLGTGTPKRTVALTT